MTANLHRAMRAPAQPPGLRVTPSPTAAEGWELALPLPGLRPDQVQIELDGDRLRIRAERGPDAPEGARALLRERAAWRIDEELRLNDRVDTTGIEASLADGLLRVRLPRRSGGARAIPVLPR
jgi:HSP20 family protein